MSYEYDPYESAPLTAQQEIILKGLEAQFGDKLQGVEFDDEDKARPIPAEEQWGIPPGRDQ
jgi:hypothetical protein